MNLLAAMTCQIEKEGAIKDPKVKKLRLIRNFRNMNSIKIDQINTSIES